MKAVRKFISHFTPLSDTESDRLFIKNFPMELYGELYWMSEGGRNIDRYQEKKILILDIFTFIYRNSHLITNRKAQSFIVLVLKFINICSGIEDYDPNPLLDSISNCITHDPNKVLFINENGMCNFFDNFIIKNTESIERFRTMCQSLYQLDRGNNTLLIPKKLTKGLKDIYAKCYTPWHLEYEQLYLNILRMISRFGLLDDIEFNANLLYRNSLNILTRHTTTNLAFFSIEYLAKIWSGIFNCSKNTFEIDGLERLIHFAALFSIQITRKLTKVNDRDGKFSLTKNKIQRLYLIYFIFMAFPMIDIRRYNWFFKVLKQLHLSFQKYIEMYSIDDIPTQDSYLILQFYAKSGLILNIPMSFNDYQIFMSFATRLYVDPSLKLHYLYLYSCNLLNIQHHLNINESSTEYILSMKNFAYDLILALSDSAYIDKLQSDSNLFMYEYLKSHDISAMTKDFINSVCLECESYLSYVVENRIPEVYGHAEYILQLHISLLIVNSFNSSTYLDKMKRDFFMRCLHENAQTVLDSKSYPEKSNTSSEIISHGIAAPQVIKCCQLSFEDILRWFILIYEHKFIFGRRDSTFENCIFLFHL
ncbi:hypothetical protein RF11_07556 [Thelohanellus kitauei]|uniref:Uncharacterized protein n=1 Tax=Thelohanellus kitauei TaxID=669202 RepID=A0A0C2MZF5_THEKT|nr:hypothetical protein RF11_07556 [Thelohanellus kitauei]